MQLNEAADMLGVHYQTTYARVRQGTLPARKTLAARRAAGLGAETTEVSTARPRGAAWRLERR